ncbi:MAG: hypothetical protein V1814_01425 [Candidatus Moraniibacteriota bacterium]
MHGEDQVRRLGFLVLEKSIGRENTMVIKFPKLIRIRNAPDLEGLEKALIGCELPPESAICIPRKKPVYLVFSVRVSALKEKYPEIARKFSEEIRIFHGDTLVFGASDCEIIH